MFPFARRLTFALLVALLLPTPAPAADNTADSEEIVRFVLDSNAWREHRSQKEAPHPGRDDVLEALAGKIVVKKGDLDGEGLRYVHAVKILDVGISDFWLTIIDREHYAQLMENIVESFISEKLTDSFLSYNALEAPLVSTRHQVLSAHASPELYEKSGGAMWEHYWKRVPNAEVKIEEALAQDRLDTLTREDLEKAVVVKHNHGSWIMMTLPDGRLWAETFTINDPGGKIPEFVVRKVSTMATGRTFDAYGGWARDTVKGHMAGEHIDVLSPDGVFRSPSALRAFVANKPAAAAPATQATAD